MWDAKQRASWKRLVDGCKDDRDRGRLIAMWQEYVGLTWPQEPLEAEADPVDRLYSKLQEFAARSPVHEIVARKIAGILEDLTNELPDAEIDYLSEDDSSIVRVLICQLRRFIP